MVHALLTLHTVEQTERPGCSPNCPLEFVVTPQGPVFGGLHVVLYPAMFKLFGVVVAIASQTPKPAVCTGLPFWSFTWYVNDLVTPQPVPKLPAEQLDSGEVESVPVTIDKLVGIWSKKFFELLGWPLSVTVTAWFPPAAVEFIGVKVALICVDELTLMPDTEMFEPALTVAPEANPVPVIVTLVAAPIEPCAGEMLLIAGATLSPPLGLWRITGQLRGAYDAMGPVVVVVVAPTPAPVWQP